MCLPTLAGLKPARVPLFALLFPPLLIVLGCGGKVEPPEEAPPAVVVWKPASSNFLEEWTEFVGTTTPVLPGHVARITLPVDGKVVSVLTGNNGKPLAEGQWVEAGTVIAKLDTTQIEENLGKLIVAEENAQRDVTKASEELGYLEDLLKNNPHRDPPIVSAVDMRRATYNLKEKQGAHKAAAKDVEAVNKQIALYTVTTPIAGRLGRVQVAVGQSCTAGTLIADVIDVDKQIDVLCFVPPSVIGRVNLKQPAHTGGADKDPSTEAPGEVTFIADQAEPETGNFAVKVRFANDKKHLRANSIQRVCIQMKDGKETLNLPETAVQEDEEVPTVVVVTEYKALDPQIEKLNNEKKDALSAGNSEKAAKLEEEVKKLEEKKATMGVAHRVQAELGLRARHLKAIEIVRLIDADKEEPGKEKLRIEIKDDQFYIDGKIAQFITEGAQGVQTGDIVKLDTGDD
jgi:RND family efflux transporter MFP subunit